MAEAEWVLALFTTDWPWLPAYLSSSTGDFLRMTTTAPNITMPTGRHEVSIGPSLSRVLKARKSEGGQNQSKFGDREFYSLRCQWLSRHIAWILRGLTLLPDNFKPESIDLSKPGTIEARQTKDGPTSVSVVRPSTQVRLATKNPAINFMIRFESLW